MSNNHYSRLKVTARMRAHHILSALPKTKKEERAQVEEWQAKVAFYYKKFKYEFSINQMHEARRSYAKAKIFADRIESMYNSPTVANLLTLNG